eukprot:TRINITY_DN24226_c0_g1_i2.p1 TRINITY_DN24226_c0_g1~~TRINITY_DN24226_c0_g1_i2.p1  ORF type:complete len:160 (-),score=32.71 TRINITY_DN24226_c0_g1_i2:311-790(-)
MGEETPHSLAVKVVATLATNLYVGSSAYISLTEVPARRSLASAEAKLSHFQATFPFAGKQQGILSLVSLIGSLYSWSQETKEDGYLLLLNAGILIALTVWTFAIILPINMQLVDGTNALKKGDAWVESLLYKWEKTHHIRTLGGFASICCMMGYWVNRG